VLGRRFVSSRRLRFRPNCRKGGKESEFMKKITEYHKKLERAENDIKKLNNEIENKSIELEALKNTKYWRLRNKIKKIIK
jgi:predicted  nucleic acid-binding Zn-ribbon protein